VSIKIPPLPQGLDPSGVSASRLPSTTATTTTTTTTTDGETTAAWIVVSQVFTVDNRTDFNDLCCLDPVVDAQTMPRVLVEPD
jgi:hypothetical protein